MFVIDGVNKMYLMQTDALMKNSFTLLEKQ